jgi:polyamine oxidase
MMKLMSTQDLLSSIVGVHITTWNHDPFALGPYSTLGVGGTSTDREEFLRPIDNCLVFAGEHASVAYPATMHGAYLSGVEAADQLSNQRAPSSAVVVGAGLAGLAASQRLISHGWSVTVIEGTDRIGGRARTQHVDMGGGGAIPIHPGAAWVHGIDGNPIRMLADQCGLSLVHPWPQTTASVAVGGASVTEQNQALIEADAYNILATLRARASASLASGEADRPMGPELGLLSAGIADAQQRAAVKSYVDLHFESLMAADLSTLSFHHGDEDYAFPGGDAYVSGSLGLIPEHLASALDVRFGERVAAIHRSPDGIRVRTSNQEHVADVCVVTVPIGVLKAGHIRFEPALPERTVSAIDHLELGYKCKVFVRFAEPWWGDAHELWSYPHADHVGPTKWANWFDASEPSGVPMLCGFLGGVEAARVQAVFAERGDHDELRREIASALTDLARVRS